MSQNKTTHEAHIASVIPIMRGVGKEVLSYFTMKKIPCGALVEITVRNKKRNAIVVSSEPARESKTTLRSSTFSVKKIGSILSKNFFLPEFIEAAKETAEYYAGTTGSILNIFAGPALKNISTTIITEQKERKDWKQKKETIKPEIVLLQAEEKERVSIYKSIIREEFARGLSVFFCLPEINEIERLSDILKKGIENYTFILHGNMPQKEVRAVWQKAARKDHPVCLIATGTFLSLPRKDIGTVIVEKESSRGYRVHMRPFPDIRTFARIYAAKIGARLIFGDIVLRPETIYKKENGEYAELSPLKFRSLSEATNELIDMKEKTEDATKPQKIIGARVKEMIALSKEQSEHMLVITARRGLYPFTVCNDCGNIIKCGKCDTAAVLHKKEGGNIFMCHTCGSVKKASDRCSHCGGWRLSTLGIGIESVEELLKEEFSDIKIFRLDKDTAKTHKKALEVRDAFYKTPGSILLGTEMAISYMREKIEHIAIVSIDSLFTIPDFRIHERIFNILLRARVHALKNFVIQTRDPENKIFSHALKGNMMDFYREEMGMRKKLDYPPFSTLIKINLSGKKQVVEKEAEKFAAMLSEYGPITYPSFISTAKGRYRMNILLRVGEGKWVDYGLLEKLRSLPIQCEIHIDPDDIL